MAKRSRRSRLAGITIPDHLKRRAVCQLCGKFIAGSHLDPVISAPSLGKGAFHWDCANKVWDELKKLDEED